MQLPNYLPHLLITNTTRASYPIIFPQHFPCKMVPKLNNILPILGMQPHNLIRIFLRLKGILQMALASSLQKFSIITSHLHQCKSASISSDTSISLSTLCFWWRILFAGQFGIHLSKYTLMDSPFPTHQQHLLLRIGNAATMLFHAYEKFGDSTASKKLHQGKYLAETLK